MVYRSLLYEHPPENTREIVEIPEFLVDLNLDRVLESIEKNCDGFQARYLFLNPLTEKDDITYRQDAFKDLEDRELQKNLRNFSLGITNITRQLESLPDFHHIQKGGWFLAAVADYCKLVRKTVSSLKNMNLRSSAMIRFRDYLIEYGDSQVFQGLEEDLAKTRKTLSEVKYTMVIRSDRVTVQAAKGNGEDYSQKVRNIFSRFGESSPGENKSPIRQFKGEGYVHSRILGLVEKLYPHEIGVLMRFSSEHESFMDDTVIKFSGEIPFYLSYIEFMAVSRRGGLSFCIPALTGNREVSARNCFDIALADKLCREGSYVVTNDLHLAGHERIIVVTGPNNGGKTTFARTIGQLFYLASLGVPVPGTEASLAVPDRIFTHFERRESIEDMRGKLEDDLVRIRNIIDGCTGESIVIVNEMLSSTTVGDAEIIGRRIISLIEQKGCLCVFVTFLDQFSKLDSAVSMVAQIDPENPEQRTFRIIREPSNGIAYARALAHKHHVSGEDLRERIANAG